MKGADLARYPVVGMAGIGIIAAVAFVWVLSLTVQPGVPQTTGPGAQIRPSAETVQNSSQSSSVGASALAVGDSQSIKKFSSVSELEKFLSTVATINPQGVSSPPPGVFKQGGPVSNREAASIGASPAAPSAQASQGASGVASPAYSTTNVQVAGVDEPDLVKNDAKYAYVLSGDKLEIIRAYPAENATIVSKVGLDVQQGQTLQNMFVLNNTVVVFYQKYVEQPVIPPYDYLPQPVSRPETHVLIINVSDRSHPSVSADYTVSGTYADARMIGKYVYLVTSSSVESYVHPWIPRVMQSSRIVSMPDIYYFDNPEQYYSFDTVTSIDTTNSTSQPVKSETYMMNPSSTIYVSKENIYIAYQRNLPFGYYPNGNSNGDRERFFQAVVPLMPSDVQTTIKSIDANTSLTSSEKWDQISSVLQNTYNKMSGDDRASLQDKIKQSLSEYDVKIARASQSTIIHKIAISSNGTINYVGRGEVEGRLLNQFSMDENGTYFRVATTSNYFIPYQGIDQRYNNVYVLDGNMSVAGKLQGIAKDESIYAARFIGDRLYLVTYQSIDPFFVIDLSSATPKILGTLKLPGYSDYLHPYDKTHIIGIGRETQPNGYGGVTNGPLKAALFDVSDVSNPKLVDSYQIGDAGSYSEALYEHKALLMDKSKNLLVLPVSIPPGYEPPADKGGVPMLRPHQTGWTGFYVFSIDPSSGFTLKGTVDHTSVEGQQGYYYGGSGSRAFYIDNTLYTITVGNLFKANSLSDMHEINKLDLGPAGGIVPYLGGQAGAPTK